ncbi:thioredoxin domain-containing protein [Devosia sp. 2618]|uniref:thioredoxin domain-containing protein n=1 Tax=Devosia sp. 2618 TaxID=3156454 RepID=UPI0033929AF7
MQRRAALLLAVGAALTGFALPAAWAQEAPAELPPADAVLYESVDQLKALAEKGPTILYFHADWCPTCKVTMTSFQARWPEVQPGITLVIADYDAETELKALYGVTYQNTYVQVNADGTKAQIWNGGGIRALNTRPIFPS